MDFALPDIVDIIHGLPAQDAVEAFLAFVNEHVDSKLLGQRKGRYDARAHNKAGGFSNATWMEALGKLTCNGERFKQTKTLAHAINATCLRWRQVEVRV